MHQYEVDAAAAARLLQVVVGLMKSRSWHEQAVLIADGTRRRM